MTNVPNIPAMIAEFRASLPEIMEGRDPMASDYVDEWLPIESAPEDGTRVLVWVPPYGPSTAHYDSGAWSCHSVFNRDASPTHWMPLPKPPVTP